MMEIILKMNAAVLKLFGEDQDTEVDKSETAINQTYDNPDMPELLASSNSLAGLSYVDSQEPGELSQACALEVVDRFLDISFIEHEGFGKKVQDVDKLKGFSAAKGSRDLAKTSTLQNTCGERGIYDWVDAQEDDDGGEFFLQKKELFFDDEGPKLRCLTEPRKSKSVRERDKKEKPCINNRQGDFVYPDSGLLHKTRSKKKSLHGEKVVPKNITNNLEEQLHEVFGPELADNCADKNIPDMFDIGPDTQMAAETMGDLCFEAHLSDSNKSDDKAVSSTGKATERNKLKNNTAHSEEHLPYSTSVGVVTRQAKRTKRISTRNSSVSSLLPDQCIITKKREDRVLEEAEQRRSAAEDVSTYNGTKLTGKVSEKSYMEDRLDFSLPVAHRTRKSTKLNRPKVFAHWVNVNDAINEQVNAHACGESKNAVNMTIEEVRRVGLTRLKQSNKICLGKASTSDINVVGKLKRSRQETSAETQHSGRLTRSRKLISRKTVNARISRNDAAICGSDLLYMKSIPVRTSSSKQGDEKGYCEATGRGAERNDRRELSPRTSYTTCATPTTRTTLRHDASPICMGDEYHRQSCRKNLSAISKRKDITTVRVLFSQHLDVDVVKQQKKILAGLGGAVASTMFDAAHFVADEFARTRNMLEAIASGKPVVTRLWIESCGQASCLIDTKNYILRDAKKEKEFGFCLPVSLERASQHPLLQGQKVFVTPNTKPGKDILVNLVKAVHGVPVERLGRPVFKDEQLADDLLILACEEDYDACAPFLEKGGTIYSSELLLNGIGKQKLEYERHGLFADHVKRTRSTMWLKETNKFLPITK
ncbi:hypothetical protein AAHA92_28944 [Salvia divinorum]|uniref:BRCT domain-containing protein n=1 Tax=Salvia divinorum TaxID=28513 RepID=A0ABD1FZW5_SALDI